MRELSALTNIALPGAQGIARGRSAPDFASDTLRPDELTMDYAMKWAIDWAERGFLPDPAIRQGIRRLLAQRLDELQAGAPEAAARQAEQFMREMRDAPIAPVPELANAQHYEVPAAFFAEVLGPQRKYSCSYWPAGVTSLEAAETAALAVTCEHAGLADGMEILELGCGWGSLTLWMAAHYPASRITAVSNSRSQRAYIEAEAAARGFGNVAVITADANAFDTDRRFDRIVSVEMFEHMRNWPRLFGRVAGWLHSDGRFFMHVFCHRSVPYAFVDAGPGDWMSRYFFSGGMMPSDELPARFQDDLRLLHRWRWDGRHYQQTANAWLERMDSRRASVWPILVATYGEENAATWWMRWRIFFMACAELFGYHGGREWWVSHYLFDRRILP